MKRLSILFGLAASPALAATGPFFSLRNTDFVVTLAFLLFVGVLLYLKVPALIGGLLDKRAAGIRADLEEARNLRDEARKILDSYEKKQREVQAQADRIVATARTEAQRAADDAKVELERSIQRRLKGAEDQIASAEASAIREVKDKAVTVAVATASELLGKQMTATRSADLIDDAIAQVAAKLH
ncbi:MAG: F0F1 ATP synthase subunit B [Paracoccaceae bacterium]